jgi:hypothetical protein
VLTTDLINKPCTLVRRLASADEDELGNEVPAEDPLDTVCELQMNRSEEPVGAGEAAISTWTFYFPPGTAIRTGDAVEVDGFGEFEFVGDGWDAKTGSPKVWHVEVQAKQTEPEERATS